MNDLLVKAHRRAKYYKAKNVCHHPAIFNHAPFMWYDGHRSAFAGKVHCSDVIELLRDVRCHVTRK